MANWLSNVSSYNVQITNGRPSGVFMAGETVEGVVVLDTTKAIQCRAVKVKLSCEARVKWIEFEDSGKEGQPQRRKIMESTRKYMESWATCFGNFYQTSCLNGAGSNAYWDADSGNGDMPIPCGNYGGSNLTIAVRVMDYDWGKKDDLLGEVLIKSEELLAQPGQPKSFPLKKKGEVTLSATIFTHSSGAEMFKLVAHQATGLRGAEWVGKNDVYVQSYVVPSDTDGEKTLPLPEKTIELPSGQYSYPFSFKIPSQDMPSSFEGGALDVCYVRWSVYSHIDISWKMDPSTRKLITVQTANAPPVERMVPITRASSEPVRIYGCSCCCFNCCDRGTADLTCTFQNQCGTAGESISVALDAVNSTDGSADLQIKLVLDYVVFANGDQNEGGREFLLHSEEVPGQGRVTYGSEKPKTLTLPVCPPSFFGKEGSNMWNSYNPIIWSYWIEVKLVMGGMMSTNVSWRFPFHMNPVPNKVVQNVYPEQASAAMKPPLEYEGLGSLNAMADPRHPIEFKIMNGGMLHQGNGLQVSTSIMGSTGIKVPIPKCEILSTQEKAVASYLNGAPSQAFVVMGRFKDDNVHVEDLNNFGEPLSFTPTFIIAAEDIMVVEGGAPPSGVLIDR